MRSSRWAILGLGGLAIGLVLGVVLVALHASGPHEVGQSRRLADGTSLTLRRVAFVATNSYNYSHQTGGPLLNFVAPILPAFIRSRLNLYGGSFGFGLEGNTNLVVITVNRGMSNGGSSVGRLRVFDDQGDEYDACWGANTLGWPSETVHGWQVRAFPRRSRTLGLRFLASTPDGRWTNAAEFQIHNSLFAQYPQWTPEPLPATKLDGDLGVTLTQFQSDNPISNAVSAARSSAEPRKTRAVFTFAEAGKPSENWQVQKLILSDATGNRWYPYLDFVKQGLNWARKGTVEFYGALWPGEDAWKLEVEVVRTAGMPPDQLWEVILPLPAPGVVTAHTNTWEHAGRTVKLVSFASPGVDHFGDFKWVAKWWGEDKNEVYSLAMEVGGDLTGWRLSALQARDQNQVEVKIMEHGNQDYPQQALFLKPSDQARSVTLILALQKSRFVQFLARPRFAGAPQSSDN